MLASYIAGQLERLSGRRPDDTIIYFFCSQGNIYKNSATAVLRGLIWQLCQLNPQLIRHGLDKVRAHGSDRIALAKNMVETLWQIFVAMIRDPLAGTVTCILDGIDECDVASTKNLTDRFSSFLASPKSPQNFKLLMTCLWAPSQMKYNDAISILSLDSELQEENSQDVKLYIETNVKRIAQENDWTPELHDQVTTALASRPNQSFHWASLVLFDLGYESQSRVPLYLKFLRNSFENVYVNTLQEIPSRHKKRVPLLLTWLLLAYHPLTIEELNALMGDETSDSEASIEDLEACIKVCRSLIVFKTETRKSGLEYKTVQTIQLSQRSVRDFLPRHTTDKVAGPGMFRVFSDKEHESIASRCLDLMKELLPAWSEGKTDDRYDLVLPYATRFWFRHIGECPEILEDDKLAEKAMSFLTQDHVNRGLWFTYLSKFRDEREYIKDRWTASKYGHHFPTINGIGEISNVIIEEEPKDYISADKFNALQLASLLGITPVVRKILDTTNLARYLRQTNIRSSLYGFSLTQPRNKVRMIGTRQGQPVLATAQLVAMTPLELAVLEGHKRIVSILLDRHPHSSMRPDSEFALETAISRCDKETVKLLMGAGASKLRASKNIDGPVGTAITNNRLDVVKFLCNSDESFWARKDSKQDEITQALLHLADDATPSPHNEPRFEEYATILLRGGASANGIVSYHERCSLRHWKYGVLQLLHSCGITLQALGPFPDEQTPLMLAILSMHLACPGVDPTEIVQFLLDSGASINQTDRKGWSALHHVANQIALGRAKKAWENMDDGEEYNLYQIAEVLIAAGIDKNIEDREKRKAADILQVVGAPVW
jgi:ankyrin repeat protein